MITHTSSSPKSNSSIFDALASKASKFKESSNFPRSTKHSRGLNAQFVREACFAQIKGQRRPTKGGGRTGDVKATAREIIGEILREKPEHYRHLTAQGISPKPPTCLWGIRPEDLPKYYEELVRKSNKQFESMLWKDGRTTRRKQRSSTTVLGTCVASYPGPADATDRRYVRWTLRVIAFARRQYGASLRGVYEHTDEKFGHVHILFDMEGANVKQIMEGPSAAIRAQRHGFVGRALSDAYKTGCQRFQDNFWRLVSRPLGLARIGEYPQPRLSWRACKAKTRAMEDHLIETEGLRKSDRDRAMKLLVTAQALAQWIRDRVADGTMKSSEADDIAHTGGLVWRLQRLDIEL